MDTPTLQSVLRILRREIRKWKVPAVGDVAERAVDRPFETLVSTILSLRTKDKVTEVASNRLLARASTPETLASLPVQEIERLIYPVGFYRTKARNLLKTCQSLLEHHLIDLFMLLIHPLVLGTGTRLFPDGTPLSELQLVDVKPTSTGVMIARYTPQKGGS